MLSSFRTKILVSMIALVLSVSVFLVVIIINHADSILIAKAQDNSDDILNTMSLYLKKESESFAEYKKLILDKRREELENQTDLVFSYFDDYYDKYKKGIFTLKQSKKMALEGIKKFRYANDEYFFVFDNNLIMLSHPNPKLLGIDANKVTDKKGKYHIREMYNQALIKGSGSTYYDWPRLSGKGDSHKLGYGEIYRRWNWFVLSGVYIDDVNREIEKRYNQILNKLRYLFKQIKGGSSSEYIFLMNKKGDFLIHPFLEGKNIFKLKGVDGKSLFDKLVQAHKDQKGHEYLWSKDSDRKQVYKKIAYVEYIEEFEWYVVSTIYKEELRKNNKIIGVYLILIVAVMISISFFVSFYLANELSSPINKISRQLEKVDFESKELPPFPKEGAAEVIKLSNFLEEIIKSLSKSYKKNKQLVHELREHKKDLEKKVVERTAELTETIDKMNDYKDKLVAQEKLASLGAVIAGVAHELKNPLNLILNSSKMLDHDVKKVGQDDCDLERIRKACSIIDKQSVKADGIIKDMLLLSTSSEKEESDVNLKELTVSIVENIKNAHQAIKENTIKVQMDLEDVGSRKICVEDYKQLLIILLNNSVYSLMKVLEDKNIEPKISLSLSKLENQIILDIKDNGNGIDEKVKNDIFTPFFTTKPPGEGTGLGLSMAHDIVMSMSGDIDLVSYEKGNVCFRVMLES